MSCQRLLIALFGAALTTAALTGCRQKMADQPRYEPLEASRLFADGTSARPPIAGTIARGQWPRTEAYATGMTLATGGKMPETPSLVGTGDYVREFPLPLTSELMFRGRERFQIYCAPCHGQDAAGAGPVVKHGYPRPPDLHIDRLSEAPIGYVFDVVSRGLRDMPDFGNRIPPRDRWAVAAYVRAIQKAGPANLQSAEASELLEQLPIAENADRQEALRQQSTIPTDAGSGRPVRPQRTAPETPEG